jgi:hypothetical protein
MPLIQINTIPINMLLELYIIILFPQINCGKNLPTSSVKVKGEKWKYSSL